MAKNKNKNRFEFEGKEYDILSSMMEVHSDLKQEILARRPGALNSAKSQVEGLSEDLQRIIISEAIKADMNQEVTMADMDNFVRTMDGMKYLAFSVVRRDVPDVTMERIEAAMNSEAKRAMAINDALNGNGVEPDPKKVSEDSPAVITTPEAT